ncbi:integral membrane protein [Pseudozyma hubeiensis SY62]|uniref:Integral membrane protein n=1 Tax=Pseudozyma hubeiensis (strain SY62) TaxID=1305764 RepID=R9P8B4_PSEHS|nr:integral membrane protein [Pseudozyma hubeiensis SY62]GAC97611.1 integral membrane protein [Pseudozyma hubeiensis SY62]
MYARNFERRPWLTLAVTNGALGVIADGAAQTLERISQAQSRQQELERQGRTASDASADSSQAKGWDLARSGRFMAFNVGMAPLLAEWNRFLEFRFPLRSSSAGTGAASAVASAASAAGKVSFRALGNRLLMDQLVFAPFGLAMFVGAMGYMERGSTDGVKDKFREMYIPALLANWQVWPLVQLVNFRYMPLKYRVPFVSTVGILWTIGLSLFSQSTRPKESPKMTETQAIQLSSPSAPTERS